MSRKRQVRYQDNKLISLLSANVYSNGKSEEIIGNAIKEYKIPREKLVLLSKCYGYVGEEYVYLWTRHDFGETLD